MWEYNVYKLTNLKFIQKIYNENKLVSDLGII